MRVVVGRRSVGWSVSLCAASGWEQIMLSTSWRGKNLPNLQAATNPRPIQSRRGKRCVVRGWSGEKGSRYPRRIIYVLVVVK